MKILACHNYYQQPGGEDRSFESEVRLLRSRGHEVVTYTRHNDDVRDISRLRLANDTIWNPRTHKELGEIIDRESPDVMHCTNVFPLISPSAYDAARDRRVPVVQSLRNYRLFCLNSYFLRDGHPCESCLHNKSPLRGVWHRCYRDDAAASAVVAAMQTYHRMRRTWTTKVDRYFTLTNFARRKFIQGGLPADRIDVKPNFLESDPAVGAGEGGFMLYVGRLSPEKGIRTLLEAWRRLRMPLALKLIGDGPEAGAVAQAAAKDQRVELLGQQPSDEVLRRMRQAKALILPSLWYEGFPRTIVEAFAAGTPVIASRLGSMIEGVDDGRTGFHFRPGDADDLALAVERLLRQPSKYDALRTAARSEYEKRYTADANYPQLIDIYEQAIRTARKRRAA